MAEEGAFWFVTVLLVALMGWVGLQVMGGSGGTRPARVPPALLRPPPRVAADASPPRPERTVPTRRGERVRTPEEAQLADLLHRRGVHYAYGDDVAGLVAQFHVPGQRLVIEFVDPDRRASWAPRHDAFRAAGFSVLALRPGSPRELEETLARKAVLFP